MPANQTVFTTTAQRSKDAAWIPWGTLQLAKLADDHYSLYYHPPGAVWMNISSTTSSSKAEGGVRLVKTKTDSAPFTFNIIVQQFGSENADFSGTFTGQDNASITWNGTFSAFSATAPATAQKQVDPELETLFYITPFEVRTGSDGKATSVEQARAWSGLIFHEVMLDALSQTPKNYFYSEKMKSSLQERVKSVVPSASDVPSDIRALSPQAIVDDNRAFLNAAAMRVVCRDLSKASWLANEFRKHVKDQVDSFFKSVMSDNPPDRDMQRHCFDALDRCYYIAYIALRPQLKTYLHDPVEWFKKFSEYIISKEHLDQWVPTLKTIPDGQPSMLTQLQMQQRKLALFKAVAGASGNSLDVDQAIAALMKALQERGVLKPGDVLLRDKHLSETKPSQLLSEETLEQLRVASAIEASSLGTVDMGSSMDINSNVTHHWLKDEAKPLGLYDWEFHFSLGSMFGLG